MLPANTDMRPTPHVLVVQSTHLQPLMAAGVLTALLELILVLVLLHACYVRLAHTVVVVLRMKHALPVSPGTMVLSLV